MSRRHSNIAHRLQAGFTLIELMIALVLGLVVIGGVLSVFLAGQQSYRTNQALGDVQDGARTAFELLARDIRGAGLTGCNNNGRMSNVINNSTNYWWADWNNAVHGYPDSVGADPGTTVGSGASQRVAGSDSIILLGTQGMGLSVASANNNGNNAANFKLNQSTTELSDGNVIIVCDQDHATMLQIVSYNNSNVTVVHNTGNAVFPGNCSKGLGYPPVCTTNGNQYSFGANSEIAKLSAVDWYIGNYVDASGAKGTSLYRTNVSVGTTGATATPEEMVRNVTKMSLSYHQSAGAGFVAANLVTDWSKVDAVQMVLTMQSTDQHASTAAKPLERTFTATTAIRNRVK